MSTIILQHPFLEVYLFDLDYKCTLGFLGGSEGKELMCNAEDLIQSLGVEDPLEKGMVTYSSNLAWRITQIEEPAQLQPIGSQKVGYDRVTNTFIFHKCIQA